MYNAELKTRFIRQYTESVITANFAQEVFNYIEPFETNSRVDYSCMTTELAIEAISSVQSLRASSMESRLAILKAYVKWCLSNGVSGVNIDLLLIEPKGVDHIRSMMIKNPSQLSLIVNKIFTPVEDRTIENIYRFYIWMLYSGMKDGQILSCTKNDIDYKHMVISTDGRDFPIYRESLDVVIFCADAEEIAERNPLHTNSRDSVRRYPGDELYRGTRKITSANGARVAVTSLVSNAYNSGAISVKLTRRSIRLSGIFYRMYEREINGFPVDFTEDAIYEMEGREYKVNKRFTIGTKMVRIARDLEEDYANWKEAFNL